MEVEKIRVLLSVPDEVIDCIEAYRVKFTNNKYKNKSQYFAELLPLYLANPSYFGFELNKGDIARYSKMEVSKKNNVSFYVSKEIYSKISQNAGEHVRTINAEIRLFLFSLYQYFKPFLNDKKSKMTPTELELYQYIEENRPEMLLDQDELLSFIVNRAADSSREYETLVQSGVDPVMAQERAHHILFENLNFCPCQMIDDIIEKNYHVTAHPTILVSCYLAVKNIFDEYPSTDEFLASPEYDILLERIEMPVIQYLRKYDLEEELETGTGQ
jgi:hypothetical protein